MNTKEKIKEIEDKPVKKREDWEHSFLLKMRHGGSVRAYLLSMGKFKEITTELENIKEALPKTAFPNYPFKNRSSDRDYLLSMGFFEEGKEMTEIELIEDVWARCKAHGWDSGDLWNTQIAPHKEGTLVKVKTQIMPKYKIISVEEVTDKMIKDSLGNSEDPLKGCRKPFTPIFKEGAKYPDDYLICGFSRVGSKIQFCPKCSLLTDKDSRGKE